MDVRIIDLVIALKKSCIRKEESIMNKFSISPAEYHGIRAIAPEEKITGGNLSSKMGLSMSRGSRVIDKLIKKRYIKQIQSPSDRRCNTVILSPKGLKVKNEIDKMLDICENEIISNIPDNEIRSFIKSLDKLTLILQTK
jgi:DNA-binding MarR family transcriptional regulator